MINTDRIVPITKTDLLTMYGNVLKIAKVEVSALPAVAGTIGVFEQTANSAVVICTEPVKSFDFGSSVTEGTVYFIPDSSFEGFTKKGAALNESGTVEADGSTLYTATLASSKITFAKVGF